MTRVEADALRAIEYATRSTVPDLSGCFRIREFDDGKCVWIRLSDDEEPEVMSFDEADPSSSLTSALSNVVSLCCSNDDGFVDPPDNSSLDETANALGGRVVGGKMAVAAAELYRTSV